MKILYNTSTGNSLYVAKKIAEKFEQCEILSIPKIMKEGRFDIDDDVIGFVYPIHWAGVPIVVYDYLSKIKINNDAYIFAVGVSGGGSADTAFYLTNKLLNRNINNYLTVRYISNYTRVGRNPTKERINVAIEKYDPKIDSFIKMIKKRESVNCNFAKGIGCIEYKIFKDYIKNKDSNFKVDDKCIRCEMCVKVCPVSNIDMKNGKPVWNGRCTDCMACINICPKKAINIGRSTIKKHRYRNPYIDAKELI